MIRAPVSDASDDRSLRFAKKYFWFGEEAVPAKDLQAYLRDEKAEIAHHNAAWSSHTGKGLLYMAKSAEQKATPAGIINLVGFDVHLICRVVR